jgi:hypothetical protein
MPCKLDSQDSALQVHVIRVYDMRSRLYKGKKVFKYLINMYNLDSLTWTIKDQLRILLDPILIA